MRFSVASLFSIHDAMKCVMKFPPGAWTGGMVSLVFRRAAAAACVKGGQQPGRVAACAARRLVAALGWGGNWAWRWRVGLAGGVGLLRSSSEEERACDRPGRGARTAVRGLQNAGRLVALLVSYRPLARDSQRQKSVCQNARRLLVE